ICLVDFFFFSSRRRHTRWPRDWSSDVCSSDLFLRAYQKLGQFAARANFGTWVYRIAANYAIDRMRQRKKEDTRKLEPAVHEEGTENDPVTLVHDAAPTPDRLAHNLDVRDHMEMALAAPSHSQR